MNKDLGKYVDNEISNAYKEGVDDGILDALNRMEDVYSGAYDILEDILDDVLDGYESTLPKKVFVEHIVNEFLNVVRDLVQDEFDVEPACCDDCEFFEECGLVSDAMDESMDIDEEEDTEALYENFLDSLKEDCNKDDCGCESCNCESDNDETIIYVVKL